MATALKSHPQVAEARANVSGAEARTGRAVAGYYPQVVIAADWSRGRSYLTPLERIRTVEVNTEALYLKQTVYDFGRTAGAVDAAQGLTEAAEDALAVARQDTVFRVRSQFYLLLAAEKQVAATRQTVTAREEVYRQAREFFDQGIRAKVDVARAEANLFAARTALIRAENNRRLGTLELAQAIGVSSLGDRVPAEPAPALVPEPGESQREAVGNRPELRQLAALKRSAEANLKVARRGYWPVLSATASAGYADRDFPPAGNVWGVGLDLTVPIFTGFSSREEVREADAGIRAIGAREENLKLQIMKEVESARLAVAEASARVASTGKEVEAAEESRSLAEGRYQEGVGSIIEVTDAQSQALEAQTSRIQATYDYYIALARLERAVGKKW